MMLNNKHNQLHPLCKLWWRCWQWWLVPFFMAAFLDRIYIWRFHLEIIALWQPINLILKWAFIRYQRSSWRGCCRTALSCILFHLCLHISSSFFDDEYDTEWRFVFLHADSTSRLVWSFSFLDCWGYITPCSSLKRAYSICFPRDSNCKSVAYILF